MRKKEIEVGILGSILGKREPVVEYRTVDGGHPAPYPDMTDEQLYNYEVAFNVPKRTFDRPPTPRRPARQEPRLEEDPRMPEMAEMTDFADGDDVTARYASTITRKRETTGSAYRRGPAGLQSEWAEQMQRSERTERAAEPEPAAGSAQATETAEAAEAAETVETAETAQPLQRPHIDLPPLDFSRPIRTITTKQPVEIITTRARHPVYKVHGYIADDEIVTVFTLDGQLSENGPRFLENVPDRSELYLNIYPNPDLRSAERYIVTQHESRSQADAAATPARIACVRAELDPEKTQIRY
jgi:hypothetical protein